MTKMNLGGQVFMKTTFIFNLFVSFVLMSGCSDKEHLDKTHIFVKHTDAEKEGLKGKVKSLIMSKYSLHDSLEYCYDGYRKVFNADGFLVEEMDTLGTAYFAYKYFYNNDGLLTKVTYSASDPIPGWEQSYRYSISERTKTIITRGPDSTGRTIQLDSSVTQYDNNGNETAYNKIANGGYDEKWSKKYDEHGFLIREQTNGAKGIVEKQYTNNDKGRVLKTAWSTGLGPQTCVYDKDGNIIQETTLHFDAQGKSITYYTGYCEFDKHGNYLKRISFCPQTGDMRIDRRVIEYY